MHAAIRLTQTTHGTGMTTDDDTKPTGYATLREALAVIIEHEAESARSSTEFGPGKAVLPSQTNAPTARAGRLWWPIISLAVC